MPLDRILLASIVTTADYMAQWDITPSDEADEWLFQALKTEGYYFRVLWKTVREAYSGTLTGFEFETIFLNQISSQFRRGFNSGLRQMGLLASDMTAAWEAELQNLMTHELTYVQKLMDDIVASARVDGGYSMFRSRVEMWAHRYSEMENLAMIRAGELMPEVMMSWVLGPTKESCADCLRYSQEGPQPVAYWKMIEAGTGHRPQSRLLACHGYNCSCSFERHENRATGMLFAPGLRNQ